MVELTCRDANSVSVISNTKHSKLRNEDALQTRNESGVFNCSTRMGSPIHAGKGHIGATTFWKMPNDVKCFALGT